MEYYEQAQDNNRKNPSISDEVAAAPSRGRQMLNKVPEVTIFFWIIKIMATTVGETAADFLNFNLHWGLTNTTLVMSVLLLITLFFQFRSRKYVPRVYWLAVVLISVVGTLVTDNLTDNLGVALETTTIIFTLALLATFAAWYASEKTLSIHSIYTTKREAFYWLAILFTFALGTAAGDLIAEGLNLGYWNSALMFAALIGVVTIAYYRIQLNAVLAFWLAYILTRPFGASFGDYLSQSRHAGGLGLGTVGTSAIFLVTILGLVIYLTKTRIDETPIPSSAD
ncbi:membrane protein [Ectobacillus panaciterrae]|uniref:COG4705 family protein n=1 Tax=Ectobacillus panaciterrae TaxID=363872 RepID=UPI0004175986|nr:membrane protein [Ectobacillus panaciterrae]